MLWLRRHRMAGEHLRVPVSPETSVVHPWRTMPAVRSRSCNEVGRSVAAGYVSTTVLSPQLIEQCFGVLQVGGIKALSEPAVDGCQQRTRLGLLALLLPQACQAHDGPQL